MSKKNLKSPVRTNQSRNKKRVFIIGAGIAGRELQIKLEKLKGHYEVVGFIDDDKKKIGKRINKTPVLGNIDQLETFIKECSISEIFIAIPSAQGETIRRVVGKAGTTNVSFKIVPRTLDIILGRVKIDQIRQVEIEDLLGRTPIKAKQKEFLKEFQGKKILVTGAAGSIGSEICRQIVLFNPSRLVCFDWWENGLFELESQLKDRPSKSNFECVVGNVQDTEKVGVVVSNAKPDYIFHTAAYKHVPLMENNPEEAVKNNVIGTHNIALIADRAGVKKFLYLSSDKAVDPSSVMGATKFLGEQILASLDRRSRTAYITVRFGNVIGSLGSVAPIFLKQILEKGIVTVTDPNMTRYFISIPEAAQLVLKASVMGKRGEIFILDMGEQVSILELAKLMIRVAGFIPDVDIPIKITGRRPGEKISESLIWEDEILEKLEGDKIYTVKRRKRLDKGFPKKVAVLENLAMKNNRKGVLDILRELAPNLQLKY